jgi:pimeloyl-ACP methyl ester carboxylesterase
VIAGHDLGAMVAHNAAILTPGILRALILLSPVVDDPRFHLLCSTQISLRHFMKFVETKGRVALEIPFNTLIDRPIQVIVDDARDLIGGGRPWKSWDPSTSTPFRATRSRRPYWVRAMCPCPS